jgi:hypothetical protein
MARLERSPYTLFMTCPLCGGDARSPIAPGYWRCANLVEEEELAGTAGAVDPWLRPTVIRSMRECGNEYAEGTGMPGPICACGTFAIGLCKECSRPICGIHSGMWEGVRLCGDHYHKERNERDGQLQREQQARNAAIQERQARERQERQRAIEEHPVKLMEARNQIPGLLAQLRASHVPREKFEVWVKRKRRRREGWLLFEDPHEGFMGPYVVPCRVTTEGEFIKGISFDSSYKNPEAMAKVIAGEHPDEWGSSFNWIMIADRLRELLSHGG